MSPAWTVRPLESRDLGSVLALAAPALEPLIPTEADLARNLLEDPGTGPDLSLLAEEEGRTVGCAVGAVRERTGHVKVLLVAPAERRRGLGTRLWGCLSQAFQARGCLGAETDGAAPIYLLPGLPEGAGPARAFLEKLGFKEIERRASMTARLQGLELDTRPSERALAAAGITIRRARPEDAPFLEREIPRAFEPAWGVEVAEGLKHHPVGVHLAFSAERLVAFSAVRIWAKNAFGPMGTVPDFEGRGLGATLLRRCLDDLRAAGEKDAVIPWVGPEAFYERKVGARRDLEYVVLARSFGPSTRSLPSR